MRFVAHGNDGSAMAYIIAASAVIERVVCRIECCARSETAHGSRPRNMGSGNGSVVDPHCSAPVGQCYRAAIFGLV